MRASLRLPLAVAASAALVSPLGAQAIGVPIAPSAFVAPGLAFGANVGVAAGRAGGLVVATLGGGEGRWQLAAGAGAVTASEAYRSPALSYGGRLGLRLLDRPRLGATGFAGYGGAHYRFDEPADGEDAGVRRTQIPVGVSVGTRGRWGGAGSGRAWGVSVAPAMVWSSLRAPEGATSATTRVSGVRVAALAEVALSRRLGVSVAYEDGRRARPDEPGARGGVLGVGVAIAR